MLSQPSRKYRPTPVPDLPDRQWPSRRIEAAPVWLSTDLRDGNQALFEPMDTARKHRMFRMLCAIGFKEIEVAFPSASQTDFDFVRQLIEQRHIPDDVTIAVLTQARPHLVARTLESLQGARRAIVHLYIATSPTFRETVFGMNREEVTQQILAAVEQTRRHADAHPETEWVLEFSPETFNATEPEFARDLCDAVVDRWGGTPEQPVIINLPATVEMATPNVYADQIEWMHRHLAHRDRIVLSVHPHNDRGTAVAAAELALMAGADRVEGCLFGQGERTGNVDLITLALNLYTQGIDPQLDFGDIDAIARVCTECSQLPISPRHPYVGDLVYTAFSGSHQDAIKKGFAARDPDAPWSIPYLPIDPADLGRTYDAVIRVNSQSGKGGIAYLLETAYGLRLPRRIQIEFAGVVQQAMDRQHQAGQSAEMSAAQLMALFEATYLAPTTAITLVESRLATAADGVTQTVKATWEAGGARFERQGSGNGPIAAFLDALDLPVRVQWYEESAMTQGSDARASAFVGLVTDDGRYSAQGAGIDANIVSASFQAIISALNRMDAFRVADPAMAFEAAAH
ncbi:2-isopropylmalate synthase [Halothiobacillus diazotrophicus]|uniref:2-isopropylmalate synthase n=1 Tax=Halothiobacillus diazotrophicus TaxID=1860122 RepID=A0A191ZHQ3_9GAMM|nr:2-isopropylmalate synthase [Halothiobacillus diazotrophicus]